MIFVERNYNSLQKVILFCFIINCPTHRFYNLQPQYYFFLIIRLNRRKAPVHEVYNNNKLVSKFITNFKRTNKDSDQRNR